MAKFIRHEPCPKCGSRDNLARYTDGSAFCFGCRYNERGTISGFIQRQNEEAISDECPESDELRLPESSSYPEHVVRWLSGYGVSVESAISRGLCYDSYWDQLLFPYYNREGRLVCIQGRNFNSERAAKAKYYNRGEAQEATSIYKAKEPERFPRRLIITEDALSAIRIARQCDAIPALGTHVPVSRIVALTSSYDAGAKSYEFVTVWLDSDKWREARTIAENFQWLGLSANTVFTELDPKCYSDAEIQQYLQK